MLETRCHTLDNGDDGDDGDGGNDCDGGNDGDDGDTDSGGGDWGDVGDDGEVQTWGSTSRSRGHRAKETKMQIQFPDNDKAWLKWWKL